MNGAIANRYCPQLDGLRAVAVGLVMLQHWIANPLGVAAPLGFVGVTIFFVLSGYLISGILFEAKARMDATAGARIGNALKTFYARRLLRILPAYYLLAVILVILNAQGVRGSLAWIVTFTTNLQFMLEPPPPSTSHLWTLGVEFQYYLAYPLVILACPARHRARILVGMIVAAFATRAALQIAGVPDNDNKYFPLSDFDAFAAGGLMAHYQRVLGNDRALAPFRARSTGILLVIVAAAVTALWWAGGDVLTLRIVWFRSFVSVISLYCLGIALLETRGPVGRLLENPAMTFVGRISYGIYLFHLLATDIGNRLFADYLLPRPLLVATCFAITLGLATMSWAVVEQPIARFKRRFPLAQAAEVNTMLP